MWEAEFTVMNSGRLSCGSRREIFRERVHGMTIRTVTKREAEAEPFRIWNAYVDLLACEDYDDLTVEQRFAHLVFWYESEVQNGGHLQYFENRGTEHLEETIEALGVLGAPCQQRILRQTSALFLSSPRLRISSVEEYVARALEVEFSTYDLQFGECSPSLTDCLEQYLVNHQSLFVLVS